MTWKYMLDTDSISYALRGHGNVASRILVEKPSALCMSTISVAELRYGADRRGSRKLHALIAAFSAGVVALSFDVEAAEHYGRLAVTLASRGTPIGVLDAMIAAHAMATKTVLVTSNTKHFGKVAGLRCENWV